MKQDCPKQIFQHLKKDFETKLKRPLSDNEVDFLHGIAREFVSEEKQMTLALTSSIQKV